MPKKGSSMSILCWRTSVACSRSTHSATAAFGSAIPLHWRCTGRCPWLSPLRPSLSGRRLGGQVAVETHGEDTQQKPPARRCAYMSHIGAREPVLDERTQPLQRGREIRPELDPVVPLERRDVDLPATHELLNRVCARQVIGAELESARHGQLVLQ